MMNETIIYQPFSARCLPSVMDVKSPGFERLSCKSAGSAQNFQKAIAVIESDMSSESLKQASKNILK